jgi:hypothetical protein
MCLLDILYAVQWVQFLDSHELQNHVDDLEFATYNCRIVCITARGIQVLYLITNRMSVPSVSILFFIQRRLTRKGIPSKVFAMPCFFFSLPMMWLLVYLVSSSMVT